MTDDRSREQKIDDVAYAFESQRFQMNLDDEATISKRQMRSLAWVAVQIIEDGPLPRPER
jgi:hypothetical protein